MILAYQLSPPPPLQGSIPLKRSKIKLQILLNVFFKCSLRLYYELLGSEKKGELRSEVIETELIGPPLLRLGESPVSLS